MKMMISNKKKVKIVMKKNQKINKNQLRKKINKVGIEKNNDKMMKIRMKERCLIYYSKN